MEVKNCRKCGRIFNYVSGPYVCKVCTDRLEEKFQEVKKYIRENTEMDMHEIANTCEVDFPQIQKWVKEERLIFSSSLNSGVRCENCDISIATGKFCDKCKAKLAKEIGGFQSVSQPKIEISKPKEQGNKMRFVKK